MTKQNYSYKEIFQIINEHLQTKYSIMIATPKSNWSRDLGMLEFDRENLLSWVEERFDIKLPFFFFNNFDTLCKTIEMTLKKKQKQNIFQKLIQRFM